MNRGKKTKVKTKYTLEVVRDVDSGLYEFTYTSGVYSCTFSDVDPVKLKRKLNISPNDVSFNIFNVMKKYLFYKEKITTKTTHTVYYSFDGHLRFEEDDGFDSVLVSDVNNLSDNLVIKKSTWEVGKRLINRMNFKDFKDLQQVYKRTDVALMKKAPIT